MRSGVRVGVDVGSVRVGIAASDPGGLIASPVAVLRRDRRGGEDLDELASITTEREAIEVLVGLPRTLKGTDGAAAAVAREYAAQLSRRIAPVPVRLVDERLSTVEATRGMRAAGISAKAGRKAVDAAAAAVILQHALDAERTSGQIPGEAAEQ